MERLYTMDEATLAAMDQIPPMLYSQRFTEEHYRTPGIAEAVIEGISGGGYLTMEQVQERLRKREKEPDDVHS